MKKTKNNPDYIREIERWAHAVEQLSERLSSMPINHDARAMRLSQTQTNEIAIWSTYQCGYRYDYAWLRDTLKDLYHKTHSIKEDIAFVVYQHKARAVTAHLLKACRENLKKCILNLTLAIDRINGRIRSCNEHAALLTNAEDKDLTTPFHEFRIGNQQADIIQSTKGSHNTKGTATS